jgi:hypothetical protein
LPTSTRSPSRDSAKPARRATIFTHNGAPSAQVGCLGIKEWIGLIAYRLAGYAAPARSDATALTL